MDSTAQAGTTYCYVAKSFDASGNFSDPSNEISITPAAQVNLAPPAGFAVLCSRDGQTATFTWLPVTGAAYYLFRLDDYRDNPDATNWYQAGTTDVQASTASTNYIAPVFPNVNYLAWVHAATSTTIGTQSSLSFICKPKPGSPKNLRAL